MLGSGLKGSLGSVGWPRQRLVGCPGSFGSLELVFMIFLGVGVCVGSTISLSPTCIVFGVCFTGLGRGQCREMSRSLNVIQPPAEQICGSRVSTPGKSMAAAVAELLSEGVPTVGMPAAQYSFFSPLFTSAVPSAFTQRVRPTSRDSAEVD